MTDIGTRLKHVLLRTYMKGDEQMSKIKVSKKAVLTVLSAVFGMGSFIVNVLSSKDETEEIAQRAAEILEEKQSSEE